MDNQQITIEYDENTAITNREATLTLSATDGSETTDITLTQEGAARELSADKVRIPVNADAASAIFNVSANVPWAITKKAEDVWVTSITPDTGTDNQQITIEYDENTAITNREAILTLAATDVGTEMVNITLTQAAAARQLAADKADIPLTVDAGDATFNVTANVPWDITKRPTDDWITSITPPTGSDDQQITITYDENTAITNRDAILTLAAHRCRGRNGEHYPHPSGWGKTTRCR